MSLPIVWDFQGHHRLASSQVTKTCGSPHNSHTFRQVGNKPPEEHTWEWMWWQDRDKATLSFKEQREWAPNECQQPLTVPAPTHLQSVSHKLCPDH